ncbi:RNA polymerase sigma factor [Sphingobacterium paucimobilis]|uniref:HTH luxR-type domain-containing protein n=1 Tax=Sphingobacterium paucimobilis HER1398 TaxID=1346330 RepID=U2IWZ4_9SPHI|nr:RNA polymerase sigma-70 factor [Sphingobacterium paucimobilis]ERJ57214.1 hypothetical protein M472_00395 [Sphingobacterium paucimobilis HER1398]
MKSTENLESDEVLWNEIVKDNQGAFAALYHKYSNSVFTATLNLIKDRNCSEDIIQEVFTTIWVKRKELEISNIRGYLYRAARNKVIDLLRSKKVHIRIEEVKDLIAREQTDSSLLQKEVNDLLNQGIKELPQRCGEILFLKKEEQLSNHEIAQRLKISPKTVENQTTIAIKKLKIALSNKLDILMFIIFYIF